jgi:hypothetical protein
MIYYIKFSPGFISSVRPKRNTWGKKRKLYEIIIRGERFHFNDKVAWTSEKIAKQVLKRALWYSCGPVKMDARYKDKYVDEIIDTIGKDPNCPIVIQEVKE